MKDVLGMLVLMLTLFVITTSTVGTISPIQYADAQGITFETSADSHGAKFFGEAAIRVVITNPDADNDNSVETLTVDIEADSEIGSSDSDSVSVPETSTGSKKFEFFLVHKASGVSPTELDSINTAGVEGDGSCAADCAPFITFGAGGNLDTGSGLYEDAKFTMTAGDEQITINYEETRATLSLDRNAYGSNSFVYISINDQDANLNPTSRDEFTVSPSGGPNDDLLELDDGEFVGDMTFEETGTNTGIFKGKYQLGSSIDTNSQGIILTLHDKANYNVGLNAPENDSNNTDEISFTVGDSDGSVGIGNQSVITWDPILSADKDSYEIGESVNMTITDKDANANSGLTDFIQLEVSTSSRGGHIEVPAFETGKDTGIFRATFVIAGGVDIESEVIEASRGDILTIIYTDKRPEDYSIKIASGENPEKDFMLKISVGATSGDVETPTTMTKPVVKDSTGHELGSISPGQQVILSTTIVNNNEQNQPFAAIVEVRDSSGITVFLAWQTGSLNPSGQAEVGLSWTPSSAGHYTMRTFAISKFTEGEVLSPVAMSELIVGS